MGFDNEKQIETFRNFANESNIIINSVATLKPDDSSIKMPLYDQQKVYSEFSTSLKSILIHFHVLKRKQNNVWCFGVTNITITLQK